MKVAYECLRSMQLAYLPQFDYTPFRHHLMAMLADPALDLRRLVPLLSLDEELSGALLRAARQRGLRTTCDLLPVARGIGTLAIRRAILDLLSVSAPQQPLPIPIREFMLGPHWKHAQLVATCCQLLAEATGYDSAPEAYTAGLFHDLGEIVLGAFGDRYRMTRTSEPHTTLDLARGINHSVVGGELLVEWGVPAIIVDAVLCHHRPREARLNRRLAALLHLADVAVDCQQRGLPIGISLFPVDKAILSDFSLGKEALLSIAGHAAILFEQRDSTWANDTQASSGSSPPALVSA